MIGKYSSRKDIRDEFTEEEARNMFFQFKEECEKQGGKQYYSNEEIEAELRIIYDSSSESLEDEDSRDVLLFGRTCQ